MSAARYEQAELSVSDGSKMIVHIARPATAVVNPPGILVFQEAFGVNDHIRAIAGRFAELGFIAIAPELYHRTGTGLAFKYDVPAADRAQHSGAVTVEGLTADVRASYDCLIRDEHCATDRIASIGFCMGGRVSYVANAVIPLAGAISFYGGGIDGLKDLAGKQHSPNLMFWGGLDKNIHAEHRRTVEDNMAAAGKPHEQVLFSYADHGFFCNERPSYNEDAARQAWVLSLEYLKVRKVII